MKRPETSYKPPTKEEEEKIAKNLQENPLSRKDFIALFFSLMITLLPRVLLILGIIVGVLWLIFGS